MEPAVLPRPVGHTRPIRVLVVDDNAGFRESLLSMLEAGNLQVVGEAGSGVEALGLVRSLAPDDVLMDDRDARPGVHHCSSSSATTRSTEGTQSKTTPSSSGPMITVDPSTAPSSASRSSTPSLASRSAR